MRELNEEKENWFVRNAIYKNNVTNVTGTYGQSINTYPINAQQVKENIKVQVRSNDIFSQADRDQIAEKWVKEPYTKYSKYENQLVVPTLAGIYVRSKSEADIADELFRNGIPFRYECELKLSNGKVYYPDFTILCPWNLKVYYWEHFGLMDDSDYRRKTYDKLNSYGEDGIIPMINLITTYETKNAPMGSVIVDEIIEHYFKI